MAKTVIITGGTKGIGKATAILFAKNGYNVVVTSRESAETKGRLVKADFKEDGVKVTFMTLDVRFEDDVKTVINETVSKFGKLDCIVNNSGAAIGNAPLVETKTTDMREMMEVNVMGVYYGMKYGIEAMLKTGGGTVVNVSSIAGLNGLYASAPYAATKHAVVGMTKAAALDYATQGIRVNAIAPGAVYTDVLKQVIETGAYDIATIESIHPMQRMGDPDDIARGIYFLASEKNTFMTGIVLPVDGGYSAQ